MSEYPHKDGAFTVIGPEAILSADRTVISYQGENYFAADAVRRWLPRMAEQCGGGHG